MQTLFLPFLIGLGFVPILLLTFIFGRRLLSFWRDTKRAEALQRESDEYRQQIYPRQARKPIENVRVIYQNGSPIFSQGMKTGKKVVLHFGQWRADDHNFPEVQYSIILKKSDTGWLADLGISFSEKTEFTNEATQVSQVVEALNSALSKGQEFDFSEYIQRWRDLDSDFTIMMSLDK